MRIHEDGSQTPLPLYTEMVNHSPEGFNWGYDGSGPAQLAYALLCDATKDKAFAEKYHQQFKDFFIANLDPHASWRMTLAEIEAFVLHTHAAEAENPQ